jgi:hypothetical protein
MTRIGSRVVAGILAGSAVVVGGWAEFGPASFYDHFPGAGHEWIAPIGAYDEHLVRDVGAAYLALFVLSLWALFGTRRDALLAGSVWTTFSAPHLVFHLFHLDEFGAGDKIGNVVALGAVAVLGLLLLVPERAT